jgi:hypothetical protein
MLSKRVLVSSLALSVALACAEAQDDSNSSSSSNTGEGGKSSGGHGGGAGKLTTAGTTGVSQGATASSGGAGISGSGSGGKNGSGGASGSANGGYASGGRAGSGGTNGGSSSAGTSHAGTSAGGTSNAGTGSTGLACVEEPVPSAGGADAGGAGGAGGGLDLFFDDFESGSAKWTTTLGTWALSADGSQAFEQSIQENKLQIAIANGVCAADQVIDAKIKVVAFKGQSNSYAAALFGRALSPSTHYLLALGSDGKLALRKRINSTSTGATAIGSAVTTAITAGQWYDVHFELIGTSLKGCIGAVCVTGTDSSIASGSVGVGTVNTSARFDDVRVAEP